ncbi:MAG: hypothetical protein ACRDOI_26840, partial [Trebonia sp.]
MAVTRRAFLAGTAATAGAGTLAAGVTAAGFPDVAGGRERDLPKQILSLFRDLPGTVGLKIVAPAHAGGRGLLFEHNASK